ncbi:MAG: HEAT repeat domain-containing protein [Planctomycetes bacterium]|nr:HEAT repeat domain-containing protein [Planctomycetota bacterium]
MRPMTIPAALCSTLFLLPLPLAMAHGGKYGGPTDTVPPNTGPQGGDTTPPGSPAPGTTIPGGPPTGNRGTPTTGGVPPGPSAGGMRGGGSYGRKDPSKSGAYEQWEFWWEANDDAFLELKSRLRQQRTTSVTTLGFGRGDPGAAALTQRISGEDRGRIRAALLVALASEEADLADSAAIALARMSSPNDAAVVLPALEAVLGHAQKSVREAATLALGIVGSSDALPVLRELLRDLPAGRARTGRDGPVEPLVRAFAAASIGMIGDVAGFEDLRAALVDPQLDADRDLQATAVRALGLLRGGAERVVPLLQQLLDDAKLDRIVRAQVPVALAQLSEQARGAIARAALPGLVQRLLSDKTDLDLLRSSAVALGRMATFDDAEALEALRAAARGRDEQTRHFAVMALAEIGRRDADGERHAKEHRDLQQLLLQELTQPKPITGAPYGALGLAVWSRNPQAPRELVEQAQGHLLDELRDEKNPNHRAAIAVSLGLADARQARAELLGLFVDERNQVLKSYVAIGLGLMGATDAADPLRAALAAKGLDPTLRLQIARALGVLGDRQAVPLLVANLREADTFVEVGSTVQALGLIGDRAAVEPLLALVGDEKQHALRRGFAAVGLGLLAERTELPWNAIFTVGSNYRAKTPALAEIFDIL